jgi:hypothetical protein
MRLVKHITTGLYRLVSKKEYNWGVYLVIKKKGILFDSSNKTWAKEFDFDFYYSDDLYNIYKLNKKESEEFDHKKAKLL